MKIAIKKSDLFVILLIIFISLFLLSPLYKSFYMSHDGEAHVARFAAYFKAFADGQIPPRWAGDLNSGYGSPLFIFFYPLPGYLASLIHLFGFKLETVFKLLIYSSFMLSPILLFIWLRNYAKAEIAFVASVIYLLLPYRFLDTYVRGDVAELLSFVFIPLIFLFIDKSRREKKILAPIIIGGLLYALFILSHNAIAIIFSPVFLAYAFLFSKSPKEFIASLNIFILGLLVSAFFWLPSISEGKFVYAKLFVEGLYKENFIPFWNLFYSSWGFGPDVNLKGGLSPQIGILYATIPFLVLPFIKKISKRKEIAFWLTIFILAVFMATSYSEPVWNVVPMIKLMGYPWRFTALSGFAACMIIFYILNSINKRVLSFSLLGLFIIVSLPFIKVKGYVDRKDDAFYYSYQGTTDYHMRASTIWTKGDFWKKATRQIEIIGGEGKIEKINRISNKHKFEIEAKTDLKLLDNTVYFPGWRAEVDGKKVPIEFQDQNHRGLITFAVPQGQHKIEIKFGESPIRLFSDTLSIIGILFIILIFSFSGKFNKLIRRL